MDSGKTRLQRGIEFYRLVQAEWLRDTQDGIPHPERVIKRSNGRCGRVDVLVEELGNLVSVVEIKATYWDAMAANRVIPNARRQIRQIWSYVNAELDIYGMELCPGVIFPHLPRRTERLELIERLFDDAGIQVVWHDETIEQCRERRNRTSQDQQTPMEWHAGRNH
jgi:hypothetical protein